MALQTEFLRKSIWFEDSHACAWMYDREITDLYGFEQIATGWLGHLSFRVCQRVLEDRSSLVLGMLIAYKLCSSDSFK